MSISMIELAGHQLANRLMIVTLLQAAATRGTIGPGVFDMAKAEAEQIAGAGGVMNEVGETARRAIAEVEQKVNFVERPDDATPIAAMLGQSTSGALMAALLDKHVLSRAELAEALDRILLGFEKHEANAGPSVEISRGVRSHLKALIESLRATPGE